MHKKKDFDEESCFRTDEQAPERVSRPKRP
jgi:hypothetical protein